MKEELSKGGGIVKKAPQWRRAADERLIKPTAEGTAEKAPQWRIVADKMLIKPTAEEQRLKREKRERRERERILREERKALALQEGLRAEDKEFYRWKSWAHEVAKKKTFKGTLSESDREGLERALVGGLPTPEWRHRILLEWHHYHKLFFACLIKRGQKAKAYKRFGAFLYGLKQRAHCEPFYVFLAAMRLLTPLFYLRPMKIGSAKYALPSPVGDKKRRALAVLSFIQVARNKKGTISTERLIELTLGALEEKGEAWKAAEKEKVLGIENRYLVRKYLR